MTEDDEFQGVFEDPSVPFKQLFTEVPPPLPPQIEKHPSGYSPMERIELQGQAYRGLASGQMPWWVIVSGWVIFGLPCLMMTVVAVTSGEPFVLIASAMPLIVLWIMWRGTRAKLTQQKARHQRQAKYQRRG